MWQDKAPPYRSFRRFSNTRPSPAAVPALAPGQPAGDSPPSATVNRPVVRIGGVAAEVLYSGLAPGFVGLYRVDARISSGSSPGNLIPLEIEISGQKSNTVTIAIQ